MFSRPFTVEVWIVIGFIVILFSSSLLIPFVFVHKKLRNKSHFNRIIGSIAFVFFMLIEIFYSGALTMFFSTAPTLPFETMEEVMRAYPTWRLMMRYGNDVYYVYKLQDGDPDYVEFWNRVLNEPDEAVFKDVNEGMNKVLSGFSVAQMQEGSIKGWIRQNPIEGEKVKIFGRGRASFYTLIVTNNSPLGIVFTACTRKMIEKGVMDRITAKWLERNKSFEIAELGSTLTVLKPGQMIIIYFIVLFMIILTVTALIMEQIWSSCGCDKIVNNVEKNVP